MTPDPYLTFPPSGTPAARVLAAGLQPGDAIVSNYVVSDTLHETTRLTLVCIGNTECFWRKEVATQSTNGFVPAGETSTPNLMTPVWTRAMLPKLHPGPLDILHEMYGDRSPEQDKAFALAFPNGGNEGGSYSGNFYLKLRYEAMQNHPLWDQVGFVHGQAVENRAAMEQILREFVALPPP